MMGELPPDQNALFYEFCLENYVPQDHLLRKIEPLLDLSALEEGRAQADTSGRRISPTNPAASYTATHRAKGVYAYSTNYLVETEHGIIVDVEATTANRSHEVESTKSMIEKISTNTTYLRAK